MTDGVKDKTQLDDVKYSLKSCFQCIALQFCNETIEVQLQANVVDVEGHEDMNPNDPSRVRLERYCKYIVTRVLLYQSC